MIKRTAYASLFALALALAAGAARAQAPLDGNAASDGNVVGGGGATISGGGDNMQSTYSTGGAGGGGAVRTQVPRLAAVTNGRVGAGNALTPEYMEPERAGPGREAWLLGGGDNAEVVYGRRR